MRNDNTSADSRLLFMALVLRMLSRDECSDVCLKRNSLLEKEEQIVIKLSNYFLQKFKMKER